MTILIAAFLHGKTRAEWMEWISERVKVNAGYETPSIIPPLYSVPTEHPTQTTTDFDLALFPPTDPVFA
jgi:hypothetical protein